jgi:hypothetical protein
LPQTAHNSSIGVIGEFLSICWASLSPAFRPAGHGLTRKLPLTGQTSNIPTSSMNRPEAGLAASQGVNAILTWRQASMNHTRHAVNPALRRL